MLILINKLNLKQEKGKLNDTRFARKLSLSRRLWGKTKNGDIPVGITLLRAITRTYPDLIPDIIEYLKDSHGQT